MICCIGWKGTSTQTLYIALGNPLRGDDGVAHRVLDLIEPALCLRVQQLTPEIADQIAHAQTVIIIDADITPGLPHIEPIAPTPVRASPLAHAMTPAEVVYLATQLFGFTGAAFVCHVPGINFDPGEGLSAQAEANAHRAANLIVGRDRITETDFQRLRKKAAVLRQKGVEQGTLVGKERPG